MAARKKPAVPPVVDVPTQGERLEIRYVALDQAVLWDENPKRHDEVGISDSIHRHGFRDAPIYDATLGALVAGNGRTHVLRKIKESGSKPPRGILADDKGAWFVPVQFGIDAASKAAAKSFAIDHNNLTLGTDFGVLEAARIWDADAYKAVLETLYDAKSLPVSVTAEDYEFLAKTISFQPDPDLGGDGSGDGAAGSHTVKIKIEAVEHLDDASAAIKKLVAEHPEWAATVSI
jgi:hypothetical protein